MLSILMKKLEDPTRPLLGPNHKLLTTFGLLLPKNPWLKCFFLLVHIYVTLFTFTEVVEIFFVKSDLNLLITNMKVSMLATISCYKIITFLVWQKDWIDLLEYATRADKASRDFSKNNNDVDKKTIDEYTSYCRKVTVCYMCLTYFTVTSMISQPFVKYVSSPSYRENTRLGLEPYVHVVSSWVPFDKNCMPGYSFALILEILACLGAGGWLSSFDASAVVVMVFFKGELQLIRASCSRIFDGGKDLAVKRIRECHDRHLELVKYAKLFDSCLSPVLFMYVVESSLMLCATTYQLTTLDSNPMQRFLTIIYLLFGILQLFVYCWHGNDVLYTSNSVMSGAFESQWWRKPYCRKEMNILTVQLSKCLIFTAGPFFNLTLATFINILKGASSYYTLITKSRNED